MAIAVVAALGCTFAEGRASMRPVLRPPKQLVAALRSAVIDGAACSRADWKEPAPLSVERHATLPDGTLLLFVQVPDYLCQHTNAAVPVTVDPRNRWRWGKPLEGEVTAVAVAPDGTLLAASQWQIEGTFPILYRSRDGLAWERIELPEQRATEGPGERLTVLRACADGIALELELDSDEGKPVTAAWVRPLQGGAWRAASAIPACDETRTLQPWSRREDARDVVFAQSARAVAIPKKLAPR